MRRARALTSAELSFCFCAGFGLDSDPAPAVDMRSEARPNDRTAQLMISHRLAISPDAAVRARHLLTAQPSAVVSRSGRSADPGRGRQRQGAARRERHPSVVSGLDHQDHDRLCDAARRQGRPDHARQAAHGLAQRGRAAAGQDGLPAGHHGDGRQRPQDADGEVGERHGGRARRRRRRLDRELRRPDEPSRAAARHDAVELRQSERPAGRRPGHLGARHGDPGARA